MTARIDNIDRRSRDSINTSFQHVLAVIDHTGCTKCYGPFVSREEAATCAETMLPPSERDLMDLCVFELYPVQKPEALRTLDDLTASGWDEDPGEPYLPGSFVKHAPAELGEDDDLVRWR